MNQKKTLCTSGDITLSELDAIMPIFFLIGSVCTAAYLLPVVLGKIDDWKNKEIEKVTQ